MLISYFLLLKHPSQSYTSAYAEAVDVPGVAVDVDEVVYC
jgi:hypothetical protein